jgi:hypothetical protein
MSGRRLWQLWLPGILQICRYLRTNKADKGGNDGNPNRHGPPRRLHNFDTKDAKALVKAERRFKTLTGAGFTAATRTASGEPVVTRTFDPTAEETLFFPRLVGG